MIEKNRKEIIGIIQERLIDKKALKDKYAKLRKLMKDPNVIKYMELSKDIERIEQDLLEYKKESKENGNSLEDSMINSCFRSNVRRFSCNHDV